MEDRQFEILGETPESVKIERNSRGFTFSVRAGSVARAFEMYDETRAAVNERLANEQEG